MKSSSENQDTPATTGQSQKSKKKKFSPFRLLRRAGLAIFIVLALLIGAAIAIPYFFKDEMIAKVEEEANNNLNAKLSFEDVGLSLFRSFPDFSLRLEGLEVMGVDEFEGLRLAGIKNFDVTLDVMSVIKGDQPIAVKSITLDEPNLYIKVLKNGKANYDIAKPSTDTATTTPTTDTSSTDFEINLKSYAIKNGNITYDDNSMGVFVDIRDLNHEGKGDFTATVYDLKTKTTADEFTVDYEGVKYFNKVKTAIDLDINVDMDNMKFTIARNKTKFNALELNLNGFVAMPTSDIEMDLAMNAPSTNFKDLLSMIPAAYTSDFKGVKANGVMKLDGKVKGIFNETTIPAFNFNLAASNASFRYPDLPLGVNNINTQVSINSPSSNLDAMTVNIPKFHIEIDKSPFDARFLLKTPLSDPYIETAVNGKLVLDDLAKAFPLNEQGIEALTGTIESNLDLKTKMSYVLEEKYEQVDMKGDLQVTNMNYVGEGMPKVVINDMKMAFTPQNVNLDNFDARLGKSDLRANGKLDNILTLFSGKKTMKGVLTLRSNQFDANEWLEAGTTTDADPNAPTTNIEDTTTVAGETEMFDRFDFTLDAEMKSITYDIYTIKNSVGKGHFTPTKMEFEELSTQVGQSDFLVQGHLDNVFGYLFDKGTLGGTALLRSRFIDANELMAIAMPPAEDAKGQNAGDAPATTDERPSKTSDEPLFGKFNVNADVQIGKVIYETYNITNINGVGNFKHDIFEVSDFGMQIGNSDLKATGIIENAIDWMFYKDQEIKGLMDLESNFFDLNQFMVAEEDQEEATAESAPATPQEPTSTENIEPFLVPKDMDFVMRAHFKEVLYDKMNLKNAEGTLTLQDEAVNMTDIKVDAFGGKMSVAGGYNTQNPEKPKFDFALDVQDFFLDKAYNQISMVQAVAPIAKYVQGKFNTTFNISGILGQDMMPDISSLTSNGMLETIDAVVKNFEPVSKLGEQLRADDLKELEIKDTKNHFTISNGFVNIDPFDIKYKDFKMNIGGKHGIMKEMDYDIKMTIPRKSLESNSVTSAVNTGIDLLSSQASKLGLDLKQGENINILAKMTGTIKNPKINIKLLGMDGSDASSSVKQKVGDEAEKLKQQAAAKADSLKRVAEQKLKEEEARIRAAAEAKADSLRKVAEQKAQDELNKVLNQGKKKVEDEANKATEKIKEKVGDEVGDAVNNKVDEVKDKVGDDVKKKAEDELNKLKNKFKWPKKGN